MPSTDARAGKHSGYESVVFTEDGGFVAGGFAQGWALLTHIIINRGKLRRVNPDLLVSDLNDS